MRRFMQPEEIKQLLQDRLVDCEVEVNGDGRHFAIRVVGEIFAGLSPVKKQQLVYGALSEQFADGSIHAVDQLVTLTPAEWQRRQAR
jgi:acid stress-induced BolA-like protein IbaG/YrbA